MIGGRCSVCSSPKRLAAEQAVAAGSSVRAAARRFGFGRNSLPRHLRDHVAPVVDGSAPTPRTGAEPEGGIQPLVDRLTREAAAASGAQFVALSRELRLALAELAKSGPQTGAVDIRDVEGWATLRRLLLDALADEPSARLKVAQAIRSFEGGA